MKELEKLIPSWLLEKISGRVYLQKILENIAWLFLDKIFRVGVGLFVGVWTARYLGPEQYGVLGYAHALVSLFAIFASLGLDSIIVRDIVNDPDCTRETLGTAFSLKLAGGFFSMLLCLGAIYYLRPGDTVTLYMVGIIAVGTIFQAFFTIDFWFRSQVEAKFTVYAQNIAFTLVSIAKVIMILNNAPLLAFAWVSTVEIMIGAAGLVAFYKLNGYSMFRWKFSYEKVRYLFGLSWPLILSGLSISMYMKIDQIMLGQMLGQYEVGIYTSAVRLSEFWNFIPAIMASSLTPAILEAKKANLVLYHHRIQQLFNILAVMAYGLAIPTTFLSHWIVTVLFGPEYSEAGIVLTIYIWSAVFMFQGVARGVWIINEDMMKFSMVNSIIGLFINVVLNYYLIPRYGLIGPAVATVVSQLLVSVASSFFYSKTIMIGKMQMKALLLVGIMKKHGG